MIWKRRPKHSADAAPDAGTAPENLADSNPEAVLDTKEMPATLDKQKEPKKDLTAADLQAIFAPPAKGEVNLPATPTPQPQGPLKVMVNGVGMVDAPTEPADPKALIHVRKLHRALLQPDASALHILRGVDLKIYPGEHVAIVGRSGTGKTTLLNQLGLLDLPSTGEYSLKGMDALRLSEARRARLRGESIGFVFQQFNLFEARTALQNVCVPLMYDGGRRFWLREEIAAQMLQRVGLEDRLDSKPTQLSGGEQQRVAIARALVRKPDLILADEPTGALDLDTGVSIMNLLEEIATENNAALVVITHDRKVAARAETVYELYDGLLHRMDPDQVVRP